MPKFGYFGQRSINFRIFQRNFPVPYFEGANFKPDICFQISPTQIPKFKNFGPKAITFLILMKFCLYAISKVLISNLTSAFCGSQRSLVPRLHKPIQCLRFATYLENDFLFFRKSLKILWPQYLFFESAYCKYDTKI